MAAIVWNASGTRIYETGVDRGVLYSSVGGVPWNGLISVTEKSVNADQTPLYLDGKKRYDMISAEDFQAEIEAYAAPAEFLPHDGVATLATGLFATQQPRLSFGFCYRTIKGNDILKNDYSYKIHLVYGVTASPTSRANKTTGSTPDPTTMTWTFDCVPPAATTYKPTAHFVVDVSLISAAKRSTLEDYLYGSSGGSPALPTPAALITMLT